VISVDLTPEILPPRTRDEFGRWLPGRSPHPGGLAPEKRLALDLAKEASPNAMRCLIGLMEDPVSPPAVRIACAVQILDRSLGRPKQSVDIEQQGRTLEQLLLAIHEEREAKQAHERGRGESDRAEPEAAGPGLAKGP
jgi:hypothetical protein